MRKYEITRFVALAVCLLGLGGRAFGETKKPGQKNDVINYYEGFLLSSTVTGSHVKNLQNEDIGTIENLIVNPETGRVRFAVLSVGGFLGVGDTNVVVPWIALTVEKTSDSSSPVYVLNTTKDKLKSAPRFDPAKLGDLYNRATAEPVFSYYEMIWIPDVSTSEEKSAKAKNKSAAEKASSSPSATASPTASSHP
jgi:hypothetical protein